MAGVEMGREAEPAARGGAPAPVAGTGHGAVMSLVDHLAELRRRIAISVAVLVVGTVVGLAFSDRLLDILRAPIGDQTLIYLSLGGAFAIRLELAVMAGVAIAFPVVALELWRFVSPGLTPHERAIARPWVPLMIVFFVIGVGVAYFILPFAAAFLRSFEIPGVLESRLTAEAYFGFVTLLFLAFGIVMQFPIVIVVLNRIGILPIARLRSSRRYVLLGILIFAVVVTPGGDPVSPSVMTAVMYGLFELTILLIGRSERRAAHA